MTRVNQHTPCGAEPLPVPSAAADPHSWAAVTDGGDAFAPLSAPAHASTPPCVPDPEVYSIRDVARIFGCTERTVRNWVRAGRLKRGGFGRSVFFSRAAIDALLRGELQGLAPDQY